MLVLVYGINTAMARQHRVEIRLNEKEYQALEEYATKFGVTRSEAVRRLIQQLMEDADK